MRDMVRLARARTLAALRRVVVLSAALALPSGCVATSVVAQGGGGVGKGRVATFGPAVQTQLYTSSSGLVLGGEAALPVPVVKSVCCAPIRGTLMIGYARAPLPYEPRVGFEAEIKGGVGRAPYVSGALDEPWAADLGARLAVPIRVSKSKSPWNSDGYATASWEFVPEATSAFFLSKGMPTTLDVEGGLALRLRLWTGILP
jgi:hypothetical protein